MIFQYPHMGFRTYSSWKKELPANEKKRSPFQVSTWKKRTLVRDDFGYDGMKEEEVVRASIEYSRFNQSSNTWTRQIIWCTQEELDDLLDALSRRSMRL